MTALNICLQRHADPRARPDPRLRHGRRGDGHVHRVVAGRDLLAVQAVARRMGRLVPAATAASRPDWGIIRSLFRFGLPTGIQGIAMNIGGVFMLAFIGSLAQSAAAQAAFAVSYSELFSLVTWTSVGLMGAAAAVAGQNLGAGQSRPRRSRGAHGGAHRARGFARRSSACSSGSSRRSCSRSSACTIRTSSGSACSCCAC